MAHCPSCRDNGRLDQSTPSAGPRQTPGPDRRSALCVPLQGLAQQPVDCGWIGLALALLHDLTDEESKQLGLALEVTLDAVGVLGQNLLDPALQGSAVRDQSKPALFDDLG